MLLAGNDSVPILSWRAGGMYSIKCRIVLTN